MRYVNDEMRFEQAIIKSKRKIVIHHTHLLGEPKNFLMDGDVIFFDDCLYSQYYYIKNNISFFKYRNISCVLGLSSNLIRKIGNKPIFDIESRKLHDGYHSGDDDMLNGFMTLEEIFELLQNKNFFIACHGAEHIEFENKNLGMIQIANMFSNDVMKARNEFNNFGISTNIFVYPYAFDFPMSNTILQKNGYKYIYAGKNSRRIEVEGLINEH